LDPLTEQEAIDAIRLPVSNLNPPIEYENELLSTVLSDLKRGGMELPHLQIICDRLYRSRAVDQTIIQMELYQNLGGVPGILGGYVSEVLGNLSSDQSTVAKRTLMALVDIGDKRETIDERVLAERISGDPAKLATILDCLITARLVQRNKTDQGVSYELGQDYLVQHIRSWIKREDPSLLFVQELLQPEVESWRRFRTVISPDKLRLLYENRGKILDLSGDAVTCLLASVLMSSTSHIEDWIDAMGGVSVVRQGLIRLATSEEMSVQVRSRAGDELGKMGDVRPGVGISTQIIPDIQLPEIHWCVVPEGDFIIGDGTAQQKAHLTEPFEISKYPVTNCQFDGFVNDHGYTERWRECWSEGGWHWKGDREGPQSSYGNQSLPNHPVVGVTGYEAEAFCNWLGKRLDRMIVLPSEIQWEKAARGEDGRRYPWGDEITPDHANYRETRIDDTTTTTAVGIFPKGASPYGVMDMSGNTWELCRSPSNVPSGSYAQRPEHHVRYVLRGGSFGLGPEFLSCAYTITTSIFKNDAIGFRVVRSWESRSLGQ
jgi:formylglycine-generating enzyme required for sulfatase activity